MMDARDRSGRGAVASSTEMLFGGMRCQQQRPKTHAGVSAREASAAEGGGGMTSMSLHLQQQHGNSSVVRGRLVDRSRLILGRSSEGFMQQQQQPLNSSSSSSSSSSSRTRVPQHYHNQHGMRAPSSYGASVNGGGKGSVVVRRSASSMGSSSSTVATGNRGTSSSSRVKRSATGGGTNDAAVGPALRQSEPFYVRGRRATRRPETIAVGRNVHSSLSRYSGVTGTGNSGASDASALDTRSRSAMWQLSSSGAHKYSQSAMAAHARHQARHPAAPDAVSVTTSLKQTQAPPPPAVATSSSSSSSSSGAPVPTSTAIPVPAAAASLAVHPPSAPSAPPGPSPPPSTTVTVAEDDTSNDHIIERPISSKRVRANLGPMRARPFSSGTVRPVSAGPGKSKHYGGSGGNSTGGKLDAESSLSPPRKSMSHEELGDLSSITLGEYMTRYLHMSPRPSAGVGAGSGAGAGGGGNRMIGWGEEESVAGTDHGSSMAFGADDHYLHHQQRSNGLEDKDCRPPDEEDVEEQQVRLPFVTCMLILIYQTRFVSKGDGDRTAAPILDVSCVCTLISVTRLTCCIAPPCRTHISVCCFDLVLYLQMHSRMQYEIGLGVHTDDELTDDEEFSIRPSSLASRRQHLPPEAVVLDHKDDVPAQKRRDGPGLPRRQPPLYGGSGGKASADDPSLLLDNEDYVDVIVDDDDGDFEFIVSSSMNGTVPSTAGKASVAASSTAPTTTATSSSSSSSRIGTGTGATLVGGSFRESYRPASGNTLDLRPATAGDAIAGQTSGTSGGATTREVDLSALSADLFSPKEYVTSPTKRVQQHISIDHLRAEPLWHDSRRPPSRQLPPAEALHLFHREEFKGGGGVSSSTAANAAVLRPHTAVVGARPFSRRSRQRPRSGPSTGPSEEEKGILNRNRPPSRGRPPPETVDL